MHRINGRPKCVTASAAQVALISTFVCSPACAVFVGICNSVPAPADLPACCHLPCTDHYHVTADLASGVYTVNCLKGCILSCECNDAVVCSPVPQSRVVWPGVTSLYASVYMLQWRTGRSMMRIAHCNVRVSSIACESIAVLPVLACMAELLPGAPLTCSLEHRGRRQHRVRHLHRVKHPV
jgi:hypothetical protein